MNLNELSREQLIELYPEIVALRKKVLEIVQKYEFSASQLVSRTFEHEIEMVYGRKVLNAEKEPDYQPLEP